MTSLQNIGGMIGRLIPTLASLALLIGCAVLTHAGTGNQGSPFPRRVLKPVDEAPKDAEFLRFRSALVSAIRSNDLTKVSRAISLSVELSFGTDGGIREFQRRWRTNESDFRANLLKVLSHGGTWETQGRGRTRIFVAPYYHTRFPHSVSGQSDGVHRFAAVLGANVILRSYGSKDAPAIGSLSYEVVECVSGEGERESGPYSKVRRWDGTQGHVSKDLLGSPWSYRAIFKEVKGKWKLVFFLAGD